MNPKSNQINDIIENTQLEYYQKEGYYYYRKVNVKCNVNFFDKIENKTKKDMLKHVNIGEVNEIIQSSKGIIKFIRALELTIRTQGRIHKIVENVYLRFDNIPILWKKQYSKIAHDRYYKHSLHCRENRFLLCK